MLHFSIAFQTRLDTASKIPEDECIAPLTASRGRSRPRQRYWT